MEIKFYKEANNCWYADLPDYIESGGTKEDCQMVAGADTWLDILAQEQNEIILTLDVNEFDGAEKLTLEKTDEGFPELGAYYRIHSFQGIDYSHLILWVCPVTLFVFGQYLKEIFYK